MDDIELYIEPIKGEAAVELLYLLCEVIENSGHEFWVTGKTLEGLEKLNRQDPSARTLDIAVVKPFQDRVLNDKFYEKKRFDDLITYNYMPLNLELRVYLYDEPIELAYKQYEDVDPFIPRDIPKHLKDFYEKYKDRVRL